MGLLSESYNPTILRGRMATDCSPRLGLSTEISGSLVMNVMGYTVGIFVPFVMEPRAACPAFGASQEWGFRFHMRRPAVGQFSIIRRSRLRNRDLILWDMLESWAIGIRNLVPGLCLI